MIDSVSCCDARDYIQEIQDRLGEESVHLVFTSPPYPGVKFWKQEYETAQGLCHMVSQTIQQIITTNILAPGGYLVVNHSDVPRGNSGLTNLHDEAASSGLTKRGSIIWSKGVTGPLPPPVFMRRPCIPHITHEYIDIFVNGDWHAREKSISLGPDEKKWLSQSIWAIQPARGPARKITLPFPFRLAERVVKLFSLPGELIFDPFCGSGTTCLAAKMFGRRFVGCDTSQDCIAWADRSLSWKS